VINGDSDEDVEKDKRSSSGNMPPRKLMTIKESDSKRSTQLEEKLSNMEMIRKLFKNKAYKYLVLTLSVLFFSISGIQYWITDYFIEVLGEPEKRVHIYFGVTAITSPIGGALLSGYWGSKIGGYGSKYALPSAIFAGVICCITAVPVPFLDNFVFVICCIWIMLFCGGFILPIVTGVMLTTVEPEMRT
jgi:MFS transporter, Spinster family, sphingosine-1-phosphate transporter